MDPLVRRVQDKCLEVAERLLTDPVFMQASISYRPKNLPPYVFCLKASYTSVINTSTPHSEELHVWAAAYKMMPTGFIMPYWYRPSGTYPVLARNTFAQQYKKSTKGIDDPAFEIYREIGELAGVPYQGHQKGLLPKPLNVKVVGGKNKLLEFSKEQAFSLSAQQEWERRVKGSRYKKLRTTGY